MKKTDFPPGALRSFQGVRDKLGAARFKAELQERKWICYWLEKETGEYHEIFEDYWQSDRTATKIIKSGFYIEYRDSGDIYNPLRPRDRYMFVIAAPEVAQERRGGRPKEIDWEDMLIFAAKQVHDEGLPETREEFKDILREWFKRKGKKVPGNTELSDRVSRIFREFGR